MPDFKHTRWEWLVPRIALGLIFTITGWSGFFNFGANKMDVSPQGQSFIDALVAFRFWPVIKLIEITCGAALLFGIFDVFAIFVLAPLIVAIALFHIVLSPQGSTLALIVFALELLALYSLRHRWKKLVRS